MAASADTLGVPSLPPDVEDETLTPNLGPAAAPVPTPVPDAHSLLARAARLGRIVAELTKARLVTLVVITAAVGYVLASDGHTSLAGLAWTLAGTALAAAGSMALNEWAEAARDALMDRTAHRPLPAGEVSRGWVLAFGLIVTATGLLVLLLATTALTAALGLAVVLTYTLVYTPLKPRSSLCTLAGAICGALPPMMGWSAVHGTLSFGAWMLGGVLFLWQIPHFLALAWLYREDYRRGGFRMLPVLDRDGRLTAAMATLYTIALLPVALTATFAGIAGPAYGAGSLLLGAIFLAGSVRLARARTDASARRLFLTSLAYLPLLLALMVADRRPSTPAAEAGALMLATAHVASLPR